MKKVQLLKLSSLGCFFLLASCGDMKNIVESPKVTVDPPRKDVAKAQGEDPLFEKQWALTKVDAKSAWAAVGSGTRRMQIAVLSSGVDYNHEDLQGNLYVNQKENTGAAQLSPKEVDKKDNDGNGFVDDIYGWDVVEGDGYPFDLLGDGTAAAGVLAATHNNGVGIKGILSEATVIPVRYIDSSGAASVDKLIEALRYVNAIESKPDLVLIQVANVKFAETAAVDAEGFFPPGMETLSQKDIFNAEISKLEKSDIPIVVSAGNRRSDIEKSKGVISELSKRKNVFIVTSTDENDQKPSAANFSAQYVVTAAPGVNVLTSAPGNKYEVKSGTFIAAAHVAGALTLALAKYHGKITTQELKTTLLKGNETSDVVAGLTEYTLGSNRLNVGKFITNLTGTR